MTEPNAKSAEAMAIFDALPRDFREFLATYPRGIPPRVADAVLDSVDGDVNEAKEHIQMIAPVGAA